MWQFTQALGSSEVGISFRNIENIAKHSQDDSQ